MQTNSKSRNGKPLIEAFCGGEQQNVSRKELKSVKNYPSPKAFV